MNIISLSSVVTLLCLVSSSRVTAGPNVLVNPGFETGSGSSAPGWKPFWARTPASGSMVIDTQTSHSGRASLKVVHRGIGDWSVEQTGEAPVSPGDILAIGAWVKCQALDDAEISVVSRGPLGETLDWMLARTTTSGTHGWQRLGRRFVAPQGAASVQFRFTGSGQGTAWIDDASLVKEGAVAQIQSSLRGRSFFLANPLLNVWLDARTGCLTVQDRRSGRTWRQGPNVNDVVVRDARVAGPSKIELDLWDVSDDLTLHAFYSLSPREPELSVSLTGIGPIGTAIRWPQPFVTAKGSWLVVPLNEGIIYPVEDPGVTPMELVTYSGHGLCMPWFGAIDPTTGAGVMSIIGTPDDAHVNIARAPGALLYAAPAWEASRGHFAYPRRLTYYFSSQGGYVAQAKRYRRWAQAEGLVRTLRDKRKLNPDVDRLIGAANIWNWDIDKPALCREMKSLGMDHVLWSSGGSPAELNTINKLGYLTGRYDIYQDVYPPGSPPYLSHEGWPQDLVWTADGNWLKGWADYHHNPDGTTTVYQGGVICSPRGLARAQRKIPEDLKTHPYGARFIDTTTAAPWRECYNPAHPLTRSQDRHYKMALLEFCSRKMKLVTGAETGIDPSVPFVDYYEGMLSLAPYRLPDSGRDLLEYKKPTPEFLKFQVGSYYRIPLWELVYHDCVVSDWYWGDYNNKAPEVWDRRDLFNILYGAPPMFMFDRAGWQKDKMRFVKSYRDICPLVRRLGYEQMLSHQFLTADHTVQQTRWSGGGEVTVNFGDNQFHLAGGRTIPPHGWTVSRSTDAAE